jgi:hypothetical protein
VVLQSEKGPQHPAKEKIEEALESKHPETVAQLAKIVTTDSVIDEANFLAIVREMANEGTITLRAPSYEIESFWDYIFAPTLSGWLWGSFVVVAVALLAVTSIPNLFPFNTIRWALGSIFILYLPGHSLIQVMLPKNKEPDSIERFALSIGLSLAVVPLIGLVLNISPWGIGFEPVVVSLGTFSAIALVAAAIRRYLEVHK